MPCDEGDVMIDRRELFINQKYFFVGNLPKNRKRKKENVCIYNINGKTMNSSLPKHASMAKIDVYAYTISNRHTNANHTPQPHLDEEKIQI
jgi:heme oxygenase